MFSIKSVPTTSDTRETVEKIVYAYIGESDQYANQQQVFIDQIRTKQDIIHQWLKIVKDIRDEDTWVFVEYRESEIQKILFSVLQCLNQLDCNKRHILIKEITNILQAPYQWKKSKKDSLIASLQSYYTQLDQQKNAHTKDKDIDISGKTNLITDMAKAQLYREFLQENGILPLAILPRKIAVSLIQSLCPENYNLNMIGNQAFLKHALSAKPALMDASEVTTNVLERYERTSLMMIKTIWKKCLGDSYDSMKLDSMYDHSGWFDPYDFTWDPRFFRIDQKSSLVAYEERFANLRWLWLLNKQKIYRSVVLDHLFADQQAFGHSVRSSHRNNSYNAIMKSNNRYREYYEYNPEKLKTQIGKKLNRIYTQNIELPPISRDNYQIHPSINPDVLLRNIQDRGDQLEVFISAHPDAVMLPQLTHIRHTWKTIDDPILAVSPVDKEQFGDNIAIGMQWGNFAHEKKVLKVVDTIDVKERMSN